MCAPRSPSAPAARHALLQAPDHGRVVVRHDPFLQVRGAEVIDPAQRPALDDLADLADRRHEAVVERHHVLDAGLLHRIQHRLRLFGRAPQRLLAQDVLARLRRHDRRLRMRVVRAAVVKQLHPVVVQHLPPVGVVALIAKTHRRRTRGLFVAAADGDHLGDRRGRINHVRQLLHGVAVRLAHKGIAQHADADFRRFVFRCRGCHRGKAGSFSHSEFSFSLNGGDRYFLANAASNATDDGAKSMPRIMSSASGAPKSRSMPESSHSIESGPW